MGSIRDDLAALRADMDALRSDWEATHSDLIEVTNMMGEVVLSYQTPMPEVKTLGEILGRD